LRTKSPLLSNSILRIPFHATVLNKCITGERTGPFRQSQTMGQHVKWPQNAGTVAGTPAWCKRAAFWAWERPRLFDAGARLAAIAKRPFRRGRFLRVPLPAAQRWRTPPAPADRPARDGRAGAGVRQPRLHPPPAWRRARRAGTVRGPTLRAAAGRAAVPARWTRGHAGPRPAHQLRRGSSPQAPSSIPGSRGAKPKVERGNEHREKLRTPVPCPSARSVGALEATLCGRCP
jgi:hypothetical protein